jgi:SNF2-related domain/Helicase conserved C-terminal domain
MASLGQNRQQTPVPSASWYKDHPRPATLQDQSLRKGLVLEADQFELLIDEIDSLCAGFAETRFTDDQRWKIKEVRDTLKITLMEGPLGAQVASWDKEVSLTAPPFWVDSALDHLIIRRWNTAATAPQRVNPPKKKEIVVKQSGPQGLTIFEDVLSMFLNDNAPPASNVEDVDPKHYSFEKFVQALQEDQLYMPQRGVVLSYNHHGDQGLVSLRNVNSPRNFRVALNNMFSSASSVEFYLIATQLDENSFVAAEGEGEAENLIRSVGKATPLEPKDVAIGAGTLTNPITVSDPQEPLMGSQSLSGKIGGRKPSQSPTVSPSPEGKRRKLAGASSSFSPSSALAGATEEVLLASSIDDALPLNTQRQTFKSPEVTQKNGSLPLSTTLRDDLPTQHLTPKDTVSAPDRLDRDKGEVPGEPFSPEDEEEIGEVLHINLDVIESSGDDGEISDEEATSNRILHDIGNNPSLGQMDIDQHLWKQCCTFFRHDPTKASLDDKVAIDGIRIPLYPHQVFASFWLLMAPIRHPGLRGGFLADDVGVGKTFEVLLFWIMNRWLVLARTEVTTAQDPSTSPEERRKHLQPGTQKDGDRCPSSKLYPFPCPCEKNSLSMRLALYAQDGPALVIVLSSTLSQWYDEAQRFIDLNHPKLQPLICKQGSGIQGSWAQLPEALNLVKSDVNRQPDHINPGAYKTTYRRKAGSSRVIIFTTRQTLHSQVITPTLFQPLDHWTKGNTLRKVPVPSKVKLQTVSWGLIVRDEFHTDKGKDTIVSKFCIAATTGPKDNAPTPHRNNPFKIAVSGTPFERSPLELISFVLSIQRPEWSRPLSDGTENPLRQCCEKEFVRICDKFLKMVQSPKMYSESQIKADTSKMNSLLRPWMIRRKGYDRFLGHAIVKLEKMNPRIVPFTTPKKLHDDIDWLATAVRDQFNAEFEERLNNWRIKGRHGPKPQPEVPAKGLGDYHALRICATFPMLARIRRLNNISKNDWSFLQKDIDEQKLLSSPQAFKKSYYGTYLDQLVEDSPKMEFIEKRINALQQARMVIFSFSPAVAMIVYMWLKKKGLGAVLYHARLNSSEREKLLKGWSGKPADESIAQQSNTAPSVKANVSQPANILVSTMSMVGTGLNMTAASRCILIDMPFSESSQTQAFGRVHRTGQKEKTSLLQLYTSDNPIEDAVRKRHTSRSNVANYLWQVSALQARNDAEKKKAQEEEEEEEDEEVIV